MSNKATPAIPTITNAPPAPPATPAINPVFESPALLVPFYQDRNETSLPSTLQFKLQTLFVSSQGISQSDPWQGFLEM
jgi:hypothetical protein